MCAEQNLLTQTTWPDDEPVDDSGWRNACQNPFDPPPAVAGRGDDLTPVDEATFYEVVEVELEDEA